MWQFHTHVFVRFVKNFQKNILFIFLQNLKWAERLKYYSAGLILSSYSHFIMKLV